MRPSRCIARGLSGGYSFPVLSAEFLLSLEPIFRVVPIFSSALLIEFVSAESNLFFLSIVPGWVFSSGGLLSDSHREFLLSARRVLHRECGNYLPNRTKLTVDFPSILSAVPWDVTPLIRLANSGAATYNLRHGNRRTAGKETN